MTVEIMKGNNEKLIEKENGRIMKEVIIYESGNAVLKVESGTTLKVLKLLYDAGQEKKGEILGVRPKSNVEGIPCIITLDESKLNGVSYDILVTDDCKPLNATKEDATATATATATTRCIDCSKESWRTKKFINIGMNTELSLNPNSEVNISKPVAISSKESNESSQPMEEVPIKAEHSSSKPKVSPDPEGQSSNTGLSFLQHTHTDYPASMLRAKQNGRESEVAAADGRSPVSPAYSADIYNGYRKTHLRYPGLEASAVHYDRFVQSHAWMVEKSRYDRRSPQRERISPGARRSPLQHQRARSPLSPRIAESRQEQRHADYPLHYHGFYDKYRPVLLPAYPHSRTRRGELPERHLYAQEADKREITAYLRQEAPPREGQHGQLAEFHQPQLHDKIHRAHIQPGDEPPVFVLPNDYDVISGIDPRVASIQERRSVKYPSPPPLTLADKEREEEIIKMKHQKVNQRPQKEKQQRIKDEYRQKSPKQMENNGGDKSPDSSTGTTNSQKLYCKICSSVFPTKSLLYKHLRGHTSDEKPFKCNECGQGFTLSSNLRQHRIIHRGYKPFQCEFCGKKFMRSNVYKQHRRIHTGEEMHKCGLCPSEFLQKYALLKHMKKNHDIDAADN